MSFLTGAGIITDAVSILRKSNDSTALRAQLLGWLNILASKLIVARPTGWTFFENGSASITPSSNVLTMPADYGSLKSLQAGTSFCFNETNRLTETEAWQRDNSSTGLSIPSGFTESVADVVTAVGPPEVTAKRYQITLHGAGFTEAVTVHYKILPADFTDATTETAWPPQCRAVLMRGLLNCFYEYDIDERASLSYQLDAQLLAELKQYDNLRKPRSQSDRRGLRRTV
jgi:hypothetical protein